MTPAYCLNLISRSFGSIESFAENFRSKIMLPLSVIIGPILPDPDGQFLILHEINSLPNSFLNI